MEFRAIYSTNSPPAIRVDIGTEWNLEIESEEKSEYDDSRRYRNRVEFRGVSSFSVICSTVGRYRNRVEFRG